MNNKPEVTKHQIKTHRIHFNTNTQNSDCQLKQIVKLITQQSKRFCYQIKHHLYKQMNFKIDFHPIGQQIKNTSLSQVKSKVLSLNSDLKKIFSLVKIYTTQEKQSNFMQQNNKNNNDKNDNIALKMGLIMSEVVGEIKKIKMNGELKQLTANMHFLNLISLIKALCTNIFEYQYQKQQYKQVLKQIRMKSEILDDYRSNKNSKCSLNQTKRQKQVIDKLKQEIQTLKIENHKIKQMFQQQIEVLKQFNKKLKNQLQQKLQYIQKNDQDYLTYIKKYNSYIDRLKIKNQNYHQLSSQMQQDQIKLKQQNMKLKKINNQLQKEYEQSQFRSTKKYQLHLFQDAYEEYTTATKKSIKLIGTKNNRIK